MAGVIARLGLEMVNIMLLWSDPSPLVYTSMVVGNCNFI